MILKEPKKSVIFIDYLRVFSIFLVILIHNGETFFDFNNDFTFSWAYANILQSFARVSVPLFFMISGFLLLKPNIDPKRFYFNRLNRILFPFLFWSILYILFRVIFQDNQISFISSIRLIVVNEVFYHLWFVYVYIGLIITIPFLSKFIKFNSDKYDLIILFLIIWFIFTSIIPFFDYFIVLSTGFSLKPNLHLNMFIGYIGFIPLGYVLSTLNFDKSKLYISLIVLATTLLFTFISNYFFNLNRQPFSQFFNYYTNPNIILMSVSVFCIFGYFSFRVSRIVLLISNLTFGIYLIHPLVIEFFKKFNLTSLFFESNFLLLRTSLVFLISFILVFIISKVPYINKFI